MPSSLTTLLPPASGSSPRPPVSVSGTGGARAIAAFLGGRPTRFPTLVSVRITVSPSRAEGFSSRAGYPACTGASRPRPALRGRVPAVLACAGTGISTCHPSATPPGLALGPDSPRADRLYPGNLGHSARGIPTPVSLLIPAFSPPGGPRGLTAPASPRRDCSPTSPPKGGSRASAACLSPGHFRRGASRLVSYYALFQCMAASGPTS